MSARKVTSAADVRDIVARRPRGPENTSEMTDLDFWTARPVLHHIRDAARAAAVGPWAVLGTVLVDAVTAVGPELVLPPIVGGPASLNPFTALVGPPGAGKGGATACARRAVAILGPDGHNARAPQYPLGTGEGLVRIFAGDGGEDAPPPPRCAIVDVPEVDMLGAQQGRQGSTLMPVLRSAWMGEHLGFTTSDRARRTSLEAHTYRVGMIAGVQPLRAGVLLDDADGGTPQRFIWLRVDDPGATRTPPPWPGQHTVHVPEVPPEGREMSVPDEIPRVVLDERHEVLTGGLGRVSLDGHGLLAREKAAAAMALLDGRADVSAEDWELAGHLIAVSDATRAEVQAIRDNAVRRQRARRAEERAEDTEHGWDVRLRKRAAGSVTRWIERNADGEWHTLGDIRQVARSDIREHIPEAVGDAVRAGKLDKTEANGMAFYRVPAP